MEDRSIEARLPPAASKDEIEGARQLVARLAWNLSRTIQRDLERQGRKAVRIPTPKVEEVRVFWDPQANVTVVRAWLGMIEYPAEVPFGPTVDQFFIDFDIEVLD
jgi:hypothetical protein